MELPLTLLSEIVRLREAPFFFPLTIVAAKLLHDDRTTQRPRKGEPEEGTGAGEEECGAPGDLVSWVEARWTFANLTEVNKK